MAQPSLICHYGQSVLIPTSKRLPNFCSNKFSTRGWTNFVSVETSSRRCKLASAQLSRRSTTKSVITRPENSRKAIVCRARAAQDAYGNCKCIEDAVSAIMTDAIQHCLNQENDRMREKVLDQMGKGMAALFRVSVGTLAAESTAPIPLPIPENLSTIADEDIEQVRRMLQLTSLPFHNTYDHDLKRLLEMLQTGDGEEGRRLTSSELSQICERVGSDLVQCLGPLAMCFPGLPLWAKHRAMLLPAKMAGKVAFSLLTGPSGR